MCIIRILTPDLWRAVTCNWHVVRGRALSTWVLTAETPLHAPAYCVGVWLPVPVISTWVASASKVLHPRLLESLADVTQESLFGGQMWGLTHPQPQG